MEHYNNYISKKAIEIYPGEYNGQNWVQVSRGAFLQLWGRLGGRGVPERRDSLGKRWMWSLRRHRTGTREYSPSPTARGKLSLLDPSLKDWKGGGLWGS